MKVNEVVKELRTLSNEELVAKIKESKKELFDLRLKQSTGSLEKPSKIRELRKNVARMQTILKERENGGETDGFPSPCYSPASALWFALHCFG